MEEKIKIGISSCLLGENVRYDGTNKLDVFLKDTLGRYFEYVPVCPEAEAGLGVPREPMRLVETGEGVRLVTSRTGRDMTGLMRKWAAGRVEELSAADLCGFIFKSKSPSSGMDRVKVYDKNGVPRPKGVGVFAEAFMARFPLTPVEDEGRLNDPKIRETFIELIFTLKRWRSLLKGRRNRGGLVDFHTGHKLLIMSHSVEHYRKMGRLVASDKGTPLQELYDSYFGMLVEALRLKSTVKKNVNVLHHIMGYFKTDISAGEKGELLEVIENYRSGFVPLIVPVTLINHYVNKYDKEYLKKQHYLNPHPVELALRNHV